MTKKVYDTLEPEDLATYQRVCAKLESVKLKPVGYSTAQIEEAHLEYYQVSADIAERYSVDVEEDWLVLAISGAICYFDR